MKANCVDSYPSCYSPSNINYEICGVDFLLRLLTSLQYIIRPFKMDSMFNINFRIHFSPELEKKKKKEEKNIVIFLNYT